VRGEHGVTDPGPLVERPQQDQRLDGGEDQVVAGHAAAGAAGLLGADAADFGGCGLAAGFGADDLQPRGDAGVEVFEGGVDGKPPAEGGGADRCVSDGLELLVAHAGAGVPAQVLGDDRVGVGVHPGAEQVPHLRLGDIAAQAELGQAPAAPAAGRVAVGGVVGGRVLMCVPVGVAAGHVAGQVGVAVADGELVERHHRPDSPRN
jgi:hypothetical protein